MQLHLTNFCNLRCCFCPTRTLVPTETLDSKNELSDKEWLQLIEDAVQFGIEEFHICGGGEPFFFRERAVKVIEMIKKHNRYGEIITNGTLFDENLIINIIGWGWDKVTFSLDGPVESVHDRIRGRRCFSKIIRNIKMLATLRKKLNKNMPRIEVHCVLCNLNFNLLPDMVTLCSKLGADSLIVQALNIWSEGMRKYSIPETEYGNFREILEKSMKLSDKLHISTNMKGFLKNQVINRANKMDTAMKIESQKAENPLDNSFIAAPCFMPWYNISVFADGRAVPCFLLQDRGEPVREKKLQEIWLSEYFNSVRGQILSKSLSRDCSRCNPLTMAKTQELRNQLIKMLGGLDG